MPSYSSRFINCEWQVISGDSCTRRQIHYMYNGVHRRHKVSAAASTVPMTGYCHAEPAGDYRMRNFALPLMSILSAGGNIQTATENYRGHFILARTQEQRYGYVSAWVLFWLRSSAARRSSQTRHHRFMAIAKILHTVSQKKFPSLNSL